MTDSKQKHNTHHFQNAHLIGLADLSLSDYLLILEKADYYSRCIQDRHFRSDTLKNRTILSLFYEDSTRTRTSFEMAAKRLGAEFISIDLRASSVNKGESLTDTVKTLEAVTQPDALIIRHKEYGAPQFVSNLVSCPVINAGDSWHEHPTQALLDALTIKQALGGIEGKTIAICGDIAHSRVAASNMILLSRLGAQIHIIAPPALMPQKFPVSKNLKTFETMEEGLKGCDIIMMLRIQKERMTAGLIGSDEDFFRTYGLTKERLAIANKKSFVLHPGPINRGIEIADDVADDPQRSLILQQVKNGVPTRMAVMDLLINKTLALD